MYSFDVETGAENWIISTSGGIQSDLIATNGIVVSVSGDIDELEQVFAVDAESGESLRTVEALTRDGYPIQIVNRQLWIQWG
jgi:outer membrane protein assembly factor BamB